MFPITSRELVGTNLGYAAILPIRIPPLLDICNLEYCQMLPLVKVNVGVFSLIPASPGYIPNRRVDGYALPT